MSNITVVTDTTEADNVTSISIDHDSSLYGPQEHDNKVKSRGLLASVVLHSPFFQALVLHDNVSFISLESPKPETVKIKIIARNDMKGLSSH